MWDNIISYKYFINSSLRFFVSNLRDKKNPDIASLSYPSAKALGSHENAVHYFLWEYGNIFYWIFSIIAITNVLALTDMQQLHCSHAVRARTANSLRSHFQRKSPGYTPAHDFFCYSWENQTWQLWDRQQLHFAVFSIFIYLLPVKIFAIPQKESNQKYSHPSSDPDLICSSA